MNSTFGTNLISIKGFQQSSVEKIPRFEEDFIPEGWNREEIDLSCDDFLQKSQKEIVDGIITGIINDEQQKKENQIEYDPDQNTIHGRMQATPDPRVCKLRSFNDFKNRPDKEVRIAKSHKQINYIASMMKEPQIAGDVEERQIPLSEVLITVSLFHPGKPLKQQEFQVLGSQPLTSLRDRLYCLSDYLLDGQQCKSGFFFIENTFYSDMRFTQTDYSKNYIDWLNEKKRYLLPGIGICAQKLMEDTSFIDLAIRIGQPYIYVHQGVCEHNIVFTDIRMINPTIDSMKVTSYPKHIFQAKIRRRKCRICDIFPARYVTYNDKMATEDPFFYCEHCYRPLHYDFEGRILYNDFEVFPYYHE